jgi:hypothetical protein
MPPNAMIPNRPAGAPDILGYGDYTTYAQPSSSGYTYSTSAQEADRRAAAARQQELDDREYKLKKASLDQDYKIATMNAKTQKERTAIDKWYNEQQVAIARERLAQDDRHFQQTHALNQARLGYDVLGMAAQLRGPENYYQAANFARGAANDPNTPVFLNALKTNSRMPDFGAQYGIPDPETLSTLSSKLGTTLGAGAPSSTANLIPGTGTTGAPPNSDNSLNQIRGLYAAGAHKLGAGSLEQLTDTELKLLKSGVDAIGGDFNTFMDQYRRSRIGQGSGAGYQAA